MTQEPLFPPPPPPPPKRQEWRSNPGPLVTLHFVDIGFNQAATVTRHWYHVPQVGDSILLRDPRGEPDEDGDGPVVMSGDVRGLLWEDGNVTVSVS
jgi:hypothetical protein